MAELQRAFISPNMISMESKYILAVVQAVRHPDNDLIIAISPIYPPEDLATLRVVIDSQDLAMVQELLGEERQLVPADDEGVVPNEDVVAAQLATAMKTLRIIAKMEEEKREPAESWRQTLFNTIELANWAVEIIERMEVDDGTPSDS